MSLILDILNELCNTEIKYKGVTVNIFGIPKFSNNKRSLSASLSRLKRAGLLDGADGEFFVTKKGRKYVESKSDSFKQFTSLVKKNDIKNLIVIFDIPETHKVKRDWFRYQLVKFGFIMIQKSVWVGPSPLPKDFLEYVKEIQLKDYFKTFKLAKAYQVSK